MLKKMLPIFWLLILGASFTIVTKHTQKFAAQRYQLVSPPPFSSLATPYLDLITLGQRGLYDDFATIWLLQILSDPNVSAESPVEIQQTALTALRHRPQLESIYRVTCFVLALDFQRPDLCENITLEGLKAFPSGWRIPVTQGFMYAYRMDDPKRAALYYGLAASRPDAPPFLSSLTAKLVDRNHLDASDLQMTLTQLVGHDDAGRRLGEILGRSSPPKVTTPTHPPSRDAIDSEDQTSESDKAASSPIEGDTGGAKDE